MRSLFLFILITSCIAANAQYNKLDTDTIKKIGLYQVTEKTTSIDSLHNTIDSSIEKYTYNRDGRLIEKDYAFIKDQSGEMQFISVKYSYNEKGFLIDSVINDPNPFSERMKVEGNNPKSTEFQYDDQGKIKKVISKWTDGSKAESEYGYTDQNLLAYIEIRTNIKQGREIRFEYVFFHPYNL